MTVVFRDPPPATAGRPKGYRPPTRWERYAEALKDNPGVWAVATETPVGRLQNGKWRAAYNPHRSIVAFHPVEEWESVIRTEGNMMVVYMRYVGPQKGNT